MSLLDKNKIFFALINYILSEQNNVDWVLKTSLINLIGMNGGISNKNYQSETLIDNVVEYIYQVKPYHVQFAEFIEKFKTDIEQVNILSENADSYDPTIKIRYDAVSSDADEQVKYEYDRLNEKEIEEYKKKWLDTTMANRLYVTKTQDSEEIKDILNAHFKGLTINGGVFDAERFGYEEFLYESNLYDSPTIEYDYMVVDYNEEGKQPDEYTKSFVFVNKSKFEMDYDKKYTDTQRYISAYKENIKTGIRTPINDIVWEIYDDKLVIDIVNGLYSWDKLVITLTYKTGDVVDKEMQNIFIAIPYDVSDSDTIKRQLVQYNDTSITVELPDVDTEKDKIIILVKKTDGSKYRLQNGDFEVDGSNAIITRQFDIFDTIIITVMDYQYLYDKIYKWEDKYGRLNNIDIDEIYTTDPENELVRKIVRLNGDKFLRANYEENRPSELTVSNPQSSLMFYLSDNNSTYAERMSYKNDSTYKTISNASNSEVIGIEYAKNQPEKTNNDINVIESITFSDNKAIGDKNFGYILINSEIIEYSEVDVETHKISKLKRGMYGTVISNIRIGDTAINYNKDDWKKRKVCCKTKSYQVKEKYDGNEKTFDAIQPETEYYYGDMVSYNDKNYACFKKNISLSDWSNEDVVNNYFSLYWEEIPDGSFGFACPTGITNNYNIEVYKLPILRLFDGYELGEESIIVNASMSYMKSHILLPVEGIREYGYLYIDNDIIPFKTIENNGTTVLIKDFLLPEKYSEYTDSIYTTDSVIYTAIPELLDESEYEIRTCLDYDVGKFIPSNNPSNDYDGIVYDRLDNPLFKIENSKVEKYIYETIDGELNVTTDMYGYVDGDGIIRDIEDNEYCKIILENGVAYRIYKRLIIYGNTEIGESYLLKAYQKGISDAVQKYTLTVNSTPSDATVKLTAPGSIQKGNTITVKANTRVDWEVSKEHYFKQTGTITMVKDEIINVELQPSVTLTVNTIPEDATTLLFADSETVYEQVGNTITVPPGTTVKYNCSKVGYYTVFDESVVNTDKTITVELSENVVIDDPDYIVIRYIWTSGKDLDTETAIVNANNTPSINNQYVGWKTSMNQRQGASVPRNTSVENSILYWAGDNTGPASVENPQEENILISCSNLYSDTYYDLLPTIIDLDLQATWFASYGTPPVKMEILAYQGGTMHFNNYRFYNEGGTQIKFKDAQGIERDSMSIETSNVPHTLKQYAKIGTVQLDKERKRVSIILEE